MNNTFLIPPQQHISCSYPRLVMNKLIENIAVYHKSHLVSATSSVLKDVVQYQTRWQ